MLAKPTLLALYVQAAATEQGQPHRLQNKDATWSLERPAYAVHMPNCSPHILYVAPVARRYRNDAILFSAVTLSAWGMEREPLQDHAGSA
jgi:hypothetical protein